MNGVLLAVSIVTGMFGAAILFIALWITPWGEVIIFLNLSRAQFLSILLLYCSTIGGIIFIAYQSRNPDA